MKESLTDFASEVSGSDIAILEDIIEKKYLKFKKFFDLMRSYTDDIKNLEYEFSEDDVLSIEVTFKKKVTLDDKKELISNWKDAGYDVSHKIDGKKMKIDIAHNE
jgi:hypothetical protein